MPSVRLCIIGGGSHYTHPMLQTFAGHVADGDLAGSTITLYDVNKEQAQVMAAFGNSVAKAKKLALRVEAHDQIETALEGADFVFSSIRVGGHQHLALDETIPQKYGLIGQETTGVSGVFMICRQAPAIQAHLRAIEAVCPNAWIINYSNPSGMATYLTRRVSKVRCLGLCDGVYGVKWLLCRLMGLPLEQAKEIEAYVAGVNHCTWSLALRYRGEDLYPRIGEWFKKMDWAAIYPGGQKMYRQIEKIYRYYGLLPGSACYTQYHFYAQDYVKTSASAGSSTHAEHLRQSTESTLKHARSQIGKPDADFMPCEPDLTAHGDQAMGVLHKMACDTGEMDVVNVENNGAIANLPAQAIVEIPAILTRQGPKPFAMGPLPDSVAGHVQATEIHYRLAVEAALTGDRNLAMQAVKAFPGHGDFDAIEQCVNVLFEAHKEWLPQFAK